MSKVCSTCKIKKPMTKYYKRSRSKDGYGYKCKPCCNEYHRKWTIENPEKYKNIARNHEKRNIRSWLITEYKDVSCVDCEKVFPWCVMDFDHRQGEEKEFSIGAFSRMSRTETNMDKVKKEIAKCDVVCANCHRVRTWITRKKND